MPGKVLRIEKRNGHPGYLDELKESAISDYQSNKEFLSFEEVFGIVGFSDMLSHFRVTFPGRLLSLDCHYPGKENWNLLWQ